MKTKVSSTPAVLRDAKGLEILAECVRLAVEEGKRDRALARLNDLRELARHAFELVQYWEP